MYTALDENEKVVGMAFALPLEAGTAPSGKKLFIKELLYDSEEIKELLLQELTLQNNISQATVNTPPTLRVPYLWVWPASSTRNA